MRFQILSNTDSDLKALFVTVLVSAENRLKQLLIAKIVYSHVA